MEMFGQHFVMYVARRMDDHEALLSVLGRHLRDFLNGLDNLHESPFCPVLVLLYLLHQAVHIFAFLVVIVVVFFYSS